jgi:F420-0:gamma-glutamyl ligase
MGFELSDEVRIIALKGMPEVGEGDDIAELIADAAKKTGSELRGRRRPRHSP